MKNVGNVTLPAHAPITANLSFIG